MAKTPKKHLKHLGELVETSKTFLDQLRGPDAAYKELTRMRRRERVLAKTLTEIHKKRKTITPKEIKALIDRAFNTLAHEHTIPDFLTKAGEENELNKD